ncbi:HEPN domain-containing protein [Pseudomonas sp. Leaf58]|uniref:ApeA N-terminal domain 1-containing protein n=1 Tax=Pseudomonas sp. Leaf58 TaxID=1736226 RepID=UPI000A88B63B|nr:HEPN domain-containing protein [Pseudomonas sp. Leaf58]
MSKKKKTAPNRHLGTFQLLDNRNVVGELKLDGKNTNVRIHLDSPIESQNIVKGTGVSYAGQQITLIDCISQPPSFIQTKEDEFRYYANIFPHYVALGSHHFDPDANCIKRISFQPKDIYTLFYDHDVLGHRFSKREDLEALLKDGARTVPLGEHPHFIYFSGKYCAIEATTSIGKISVHHRPAFNTRPPASAHIDNRMLISLEFHSHLTFKEAMDNLLTLNCFLSYVAGRVQGIKNIEIETSIDADETPKPLAVFASYATKTSAKGSHHKPHAGDIPLNPINSPDEFKRVLTSWIDRHHEWAASRWRYVGCLEKGDLYDIDRLVAAANMFDILPPDATPIPASISAELEKARKECQKIFRDLPVSPDRNSILNSLGRIGKPSLPKKVNYRAQIVANHFGKSLPEISTACTTGVKIRNYFVHGSLNGINYKKIQPLIPFLTDALEFVFSASDLIEAGWDTQQWLDNHHGFGHSFSRFLIHYKEHSDELIKALDSDTELSSSE